MTSKTASLKDVRYSAGSRSNLREELCLLVDDNPERVSKDVMMMGNGRGKFRSLSPVRKIRIKGAQKIQINRQPSVTSRDELFDGLVVIHVSVLLLKKSSELTLQIRLRLFGRLHLFLHTRTRRALRSDLGFEKSNEDSRFYEEMRILGNGKMYHTCSRRIMFYNNRNIRLKTM